MSAANTVGRPNPGLLDWLASHHIEYEVHEHDPAFTAQATATAEGVDPRTFAKVVGVAAPDDRNILIVLDATDHLDLHKARRALGTGDVRLLSEDELICPGARLRSRRHARRWLAVRTRVVRRLRRAG